MKSTSWIRPPAALLAAFGIAFSAPSQRVPEGVHSDARGPSELCGLSAANALEFIALLKSSAGVEPVATDSGRFELFSADDGMRQWVVTRPSEPAHPAATCRHLFQGPDGSWYQTRSMRCDASRDLCDRLFIEFRELDEQLRQSFEQGD